MMKIKWDEEELVELEPKQEEQTTMKTKKRDDQLIGKEMIN